MVNALAPAWDLNPSNSTGLKKKQEQMHLRGKYIASIRDNLTATLDNSSVVDEKGNKRKLRRKPNLKIVSDDEK